jgi:hypothetical protein
MAAISQFNPAVSCFPALGRETGNERKQEWKHRETDSRKPFKGQGFQETNNETSHLKSGNEAPTFRFHPDYETQYHQWPSNPLKNAQKQKFKTRPTA